MNTDGIKYIPNAFYDMMVFIVPTAQASILTFLGIKHIDINQLKDISVANIIILALLIVLSSYEYGRIAEALSAYLVQDVLKFIRKHTRFFRNKDFLKDRREVYKVLKLENCSDGRTGDKWVIYMYAFDKKPALGMDLLKRYAWEKLSRNSAFTYASILIISIFIQIFHLLSGEGLTVLPFDFGNVSYTGFCFVMACFTYVEYYRRNVWNYDLLTKIVPVLLS